MLCIVLRVQRGYIAGASFFIDKVLETWPPPLRLKDKINIEFGKIVTSF